MNLEVAEQVANAVLYEGYMLYPYRPSAIKNRQRWTFGTIYPRAYDEVGRGTESAAMHTECLFTANAAAAINVRLRFLHLTARQIVNLAGESIPSLKIDGRRLESWDEGVSRSVDFVVTDVAGPPVSMGFNFPGTKDTEQLRNMEGMLLGSVTRRQQEINGTITCSVERVLDEVFKLAISVANETDLRGDPSDRNEALLNSFLSSHMIIRAEDAELVSLLDPPGELSDLVKSCKNVGNFPVLVGDAGTREMLLCSPIVLYDYPQIAPESAGDFFDSTEMDEMLTLRVLTLTNEEKDEMRMADDHVRNLLQRTEESAREQLIRTHGVIRGLRPVSGNDE